MLLRVYVDSRPAFDRWIASQSRSQPVQVNDTLSSGQRIFQKTSCVNCHTIAGTAATGRYGPDLTHLMSRDTIASGVLPNTADNLRLWIQNPDALKPGARMPAMNLNSQELDEVTVYLTSLH
jgi:cytochrome c oxidase subunit 2